MKQLLLFMLLPLWSLSQEAELATKINGQWEFSINIVQVANDVLPGNSYVSFDSAYIDTLSQTIQILDFTGSSTKCDRVLYQVIGNVMYTKYDSYASVAMLTCEDNDCCSACIKTAEGVCDCSLICTKGACDKRTYGYGQIPSAGMSNAIRAYLN